MIACIHVMKASSGDRNIGCGEAVAEALRTLKRNHNKVELLSVVTAQITNVSPTFGEVTRADLIVEVED